MPDTNLTPDDVRAQRALKYRDATARPVQRSAGSLPGSTGLWTPAIRTACRVERAAAGSKTPDAVRFMGLSSVTDRAYRMYDWLGEYDEVVSGDAFDVTLAQDGLDVPQVLNHDSLRRLARTGNAESPLELSMGEFEGQYGFRSVAPTMQLSDPDVAYIVPKLESGLIDEMSFRFSIDAGRWSDDFTTYTIQRVNIHRGDTSIVGYGANPHTAGAGLRAANDEFVKRHLFQSALLNRDRQLS